MKPILLLSIFGVLIFSCSLEYENSVSEELSETIPSSILFNVAQVQVKNGSPRASFSAQEARIWEEREDTELYKVEFLEFDGHRSIITRGVADYLLIDKNNNATITGNISGYSAQNEAAMVADSLQWEDETRSLKSLNESSVEISMDEGSVLKGNGFTADFYTNTIIFSSQVEGVIDTETDVADD